MEILLATALLSILAAASISLVYWQMRAQSHVSYNAMQSGRLINAQTMMRKVLRSCYPASLTLNADRIWFQENSAPALPVELFSWTNGALNYRTEPVLEEVIASFSKLTASGALQLDALPLASDVSNLVRVELTTQGREPRNISFIVRPRGANE